MSERKTASIKVMVIPDIKKKLKEKAEGLGLTLTSYIEKVAREPIIFLDLNSRTLLSALKLKTS